MKTHSSSLALAAIFWAGMICPARCGVIEASVNIEDPKFNGDASNGDVVEDFIQSQNPFGLGQAEARAEFGHLEASSFAEWNPFIHKGAHYQSVALWGDEINFDIEGFLTGTFDFSVTPVFSIKTFSNSEQVSPSAVVSLRVDVGSIINVAGAYHATLNSTGYNANMESGQELTFTVPFSITAGPVGIGVEITSRAFIGESSGPFTGNEGGTAFANMGDSLTWGGIRNVRDSSGNLVENWTVTSQSGFDYSQPFIVPEPGTLALALLWAAMIPYSMLRRKRVRGRNQRTGSARLARGN